MTPVDYFLLVVSSYTKHAQCPMPMLYINQLSIPCNEYSLFYRNISKYIDKCLSGKDDKSKHCEKQLFLENASTGKEIAHICRNVANIHKEVWICSL